MKTYFESNPKETTFSEEENVLREYVMDCGLICQKQRGSYAKIAAEGVWAHLSLWIRSGRLRLDGERRGEPAASRNSGQGRGHSGAMAEAHRSFTNCRYRPWFTMGIAQGERGQDCELTSAILGGVERTEEACGLAGRRWTMALGCGAVTAN